MEKKINKTLEKVQKDTQRTHSQNILNEIENSAKTLGDPNCPHCGGVGYIRVDVPVGHEKFGKLEVCVCRAIDVAENARVRLFALSNLDRLSHLTFDNFNKSGNKTAIFMTESEKESLVKAFATCDDYSKNQSGWLLLEGGYGCGKTHLAAAIANYAVDHGTPTLFITVPDLLDTLRFSYSDKDVTFEERFGEIRNANLLILDDFGTHNATAWAQEKLFQILNYRYINKLPTVITTNLLLDEIEGRIRSRLQDSEFVKNVKITAPDYRRPEETSNPGLSMLTSPSIKSMTFGTFDFRESEVGEKIVTTVRTKQEYGRDKRQVTNIIHDAVTANGIKSLKAAYHAALDFAEQPKGWLILLGKSYCGKTHLAAAIGNVTSRQVIMTGVSSLLDYLKRPFDQNSDISFDRRYQEIKTSPILILDDMQESGSRSSWAEDKLYQLLIHRYNYQLPTVITSTMAPEDFAINYPSIWNRILDATISSIYVIDMPPYRRATKSKRASSTRKNK